MELEGYLKHIGQNIKRLREEKNLTQMELAHRCEMDRSNYHKIEAGNSNVKAETIWKLSMALEVDPAEIVRIK